MAAALVASGLSPPECGTLRPVPPSLPDRRKRRDYAVSLFAHARAIFSPASFRSA